MGISKQERLEISDVGTEYRGKKRKKVNRCTCFIITTIVLACTVLLGWGLGVALQKDNDRGEAEPIRYTYVINTTWDGKKIAHDTVNITLTSSNDDVKVNIEAPFFNDPGNPGGEPGKPFPGLWNYEVVELFFLNDAGQYVELIFSPHGQYLVILYISHREKIKEQLPLEFGSSLSSTNWSGEAVVPSGYFPVAVTKMNAYFVYGSGDKRKHEALYPARDGKYAEPDLHRFEYFQPIDFVKLLPSNAPDKYTPSMWFVYEITRTWNDLPTNHSVIQFTLVSHEEGVKILMKAPFFNDPPNPGGPPGEPFPGLWDYEVVEMFFLNDQDHYIELEFCPHGQHLLLLLNGYRSTFKEQLPLNFTSAINNNTWSGEAVIPSGYFPKAVTKMNAYAIHGSDEDRIYEALNPTPYGKYPEPDFHRLEYFMPIDFIQLDPSNAGDNYSSNVWFVYEITRTWNDLPTNHSVIQFTLVSHEEGVKILMKAPFFNDPPNPGGPPGEPFPGLWDYEVVEMFFLNDNGCYVELEFCPHGQHLVLLLNGTRQSFMEQLPLNFTSTIINNDTWSGEAVIPSGYFPKAVTKMNAYAIHGSDENRIYEALYPTPYGKYPEPDFHRLEYFEAIEFVYLDPTNMGDMYESPVWQGVC